MGPPNQQRQQLRFALRQAFIQTEVISEKAFLFLK